LIVLLKRQLRDVEFAEKVRTTFHSGPVKTIHTFKNRRNGTEKGHLPAIWLNCGGDFGTMLLTIQG
jgi:hypothetical protein